MYRAVPIVDNCRPSARRTDVVGPMRCRKTLAKRPLMLHHHHRQLTFLASLLSSALYHFCALSAAAGTSRVDLPNFLVVGFVDMVNSLGCVFGVEGCGEGKGRSQRHRS